VDEQRQLLDRLTGALRADERVLATWIIGSLASGVGDASSDVDLLLAIDERAFGALTRDWQVWLGQLIPTVYARRLGAAERPTITAITPDWRCFDLTLASAADPSPFPYAATLHFARPGYRPALRFTAPAAHGADPSRLADLVGEFLRVLGLMPAVIGRGEYLVSMTGALLQRNALIELMLSGDLQDAQANVVSVARDSCGGGQFAPSQETDGILVRRSCKSKAGRNSRSGAPSGRH
jgi:predicted nucleotidyltransferase